jgi:uncharacterized protein (DUF488 family)
MREHTPASTHTVYTIGHSNHTLEKFLDLLTAQDIEVLIDTRSQPYSKYAVHFNARELHAAVTARGLGYLFLGKELGGRPEGAEFYDADGYVLYSRVAVSPLFLAGLSRLETAAAQQRVALLCSEEDPAVCHRYLLIGRVLAERGISLRHIRGDGRLQTDAEVEAEAQPDDSGQQALFADEEVAEWKSIRSVLPKKPPPSFSGY